MMQSNQQKAKKRTNISIDTNIFMQLAEQARIKNRTLSSFVNEALLTSVLVTSDGGSLSNV